MKKISFENDYNAGAHPKVLESLLKTNMEKLPGYGADIYSERAKEKICSACGLDRGKVFFLMGGTQTNSIVIASCLKDFEGVIAAESGHINTHEAGAVEYAGSKVLALSEHNGKIAPYELKEYLAKFFSDENREHMVYPGMVYISHPTEYGTLYTLKELSDISEICGTYDIKLFIDGARLGYGLMSENTDVSIKDIARLCDVFYIGGTKAGALCGEAVVFTKGNMPPHFVNFVKKRGALAAKGRLMGVQFDALFTNGLYFDICRHAINMAEKLKEIFKRKGYEFFIESPTNQQFVIMENSKLSALREKADVSIWERYDESHTVVRFVTSWSTLEEELEALEGLL